MQQVCSTSQTQLSPPKASQRGFLRHRPSLSQHSRPGIASQAAPADAARARGRRRAPPGGPPLHKQCTWAPQRVSRDLLPSGGRDQGRRAPCWARSARVGSARRTPLASIQPAPPNLRAASTVTQCRHSRDGTSGPAGKGMPAGRGDMAGGRRRRARAAPRRAAPCAMRLARLACWVSGQPPTRAPACEDESLRMPPHPRERMCSTVAALPRHSVRYPSHADRCTGSACGWRVAASCCETTPDQSAPACSDMCAVQRRAR